MCHERWQSKNEEIIKNKWNSLFCAWSYIFFNCATPWQLTFYLSYFSIIYNIFMSVFYLIKVGFKTGIRSILVVNKLTTSIWFAWVIKKLNSSWWRNQARWQVLCCFCKIDLINNAIPFSENTSKYHWEQTTSLLEILFLLLLV